MTTSIWSIIAVVIACVIGAFASVLMKKASADFRINLKAMLRNKYLLTAVFLYGISTVIFIPALKYGELSVLYPLVATTYIWVAFLSTRYLGEKINKWKWLGILFILIGVSLIGMGT